MKGLFITFEGLDGSGKTTQIHKLNKYLQEKGIQVLLTREPGGTQIGEKIRKLLLDVENTNMDKRTEALLYAASRAQHIHQKIKPALENGQIVLCDRFLESSLIYQGMARELGVKEVFDINAFAIDGIFPNFTILLEVNLELAMDRIANRKECDRLDKESENFHKMVYRGYKELKTMYPDRIVSVDANLSEEETFEQILDLIKPKLEI